MLLPILSGAQAPTGKAQDQPREQLKVGDIIYDLELQNVINYKDSTLRLKDFKGKLVILDFWAPYCGSCIKSFPKIDSLQQNYKDRIQFILVTHSFGEGKYSPRAVKELFTQLQIQCPGKYTFPVAVSGNEKIMELFYHGGLPYYVWISAKGKINAFTSYHLLNAQTIEAFLNIL